MHDKAWFLRTLIHDLQRIIRCLIRDLFKRDILSFVIEKFKLKYLKIYDRFIYSKEN